jgi:hypothetical protein
MPNEVRLSLPITFYSSEGLRAAVAAFKELCDVRVEPIGPGTALTIRLRPPAGPETTLEFLNYALMASIEPHLVSENA